MQRVTLLLLGMAILLRVGSMTFDFSTIKPVARQEETQRFDFSTMKPTNQTPMQMFDEAVAREEAESDFTKEEKDFLVEQEGASLDSTLTSHIKLREGVVPRSYRDKLGVLTAGVGHRLIGEEAKAFPEGTEIPQDKIDEWLEADLEESLKAAQRQSEELGVDSEELISALASVNFQLGTNWNKEHKNTWRLMKEGRWGEAAEEAAKSDWKEQTPVRVEDFQQALREVAKDEG